MRNKYMTLFAYDVQPLAKEIIRKTKMSRSLGGNHLHRQIEPTIKPKCQNSNI